MQVKLSFGLPLKQHLTTNYSEILYDTHAINAYDTLQQGNDESTKAYLHIAQDILECVHHTNNMTSISAIVTNHAKMLTGLKDSRLRNKLAKPKAKMWINMVQVPQDVVDMAVNFKRSSGYSLPTFEVNQTSLYNNHPSGNLYRSNKLPVREAQQPSLKADKLKFWNCQGDHLKKDCPTTPQQSSPLQPKTHFHKESCVILLNLFIKDFWIANHKSMRLPYLLKTTASMISLISSFQNLTI